MSGSEEEEGEVIPLCSGPRRAFTDVEIERIKAFFDRPECADNAKSARDRVLFYLLVLTGYRGHEIAGMRWKYCYNFRRDRFRQCIFIPKRYIKGSRKVRSIWTPPQLLLELQRWKALYPAIYGTEPEPEHYVVSSVRKGKGRRLSEGHMWRIVKEGIYNQACDGPEFDDTHIGVHSGRKFAITKRYRITNSAADACRFAGHSEPATTMRYISNNTAEEECDIAARMHV